MGWVGRLGVNVRCLCGWVCRCVGGGGGGIFSSIKSRYMMLVISRQVMFLLCMLVPGSYWEVNRTAKMRYWYSRSCLRTKLHICKYISNIFCIGLNISLNTCTINWNRILSPISCKLHKIWYVNNEYRRSNDYSHDGYFHSISTLNLDDIFHVCTLRMNSYVTGYGTKAAF